MHAAGGGKGGEGGVSGGGGGGTEGGAGGEGGTEGGEAGEGGAGGCGGPPPQTRPVLHDDEEEAPHGSGHQKWLVSGAEAGRPQ